MRRRGGRYNRITLGSCIARFCISTVNLGLLWRLGLEVPSNLRDFQPNVSPTCELGRIGVKVEEDTTDSEAG